MDTAAILTLSSADIDSLDELELMTLLGLDVEEARAKGYQNAGMLRGALITAAWQLRSGNSVQSEQVAPMPLTITRAEHAARMNAERRRLRGLAFAAKERYSWCSTADDVVATAGLNHVDTTNALVGEYVIRIPVRFLPADEDLRAMVASGESDRADTAIRIIRNSVDQMYSCNVRGEYNESDQLIDLYADYELRSAICVQADNVHSVVSDQGVKAQARLENLRVEES